MENETSGSSMGDSTPLAVRLSVQLDEQGRIAWARMRPETRAKLQDALKGDTVVPFVPSGPVAVPGPSVETFPPALAEVLYDSLSMLLMGLARRGGYTQDEAAVLMFAPQEKQALVPPTLAVLNKYNASLGKYQEEIILGTLLTTIISGKIALLKKSGEIRPFPVSDTNAGSRQAENEA